MKNIVVNKYIIFLDIDLVRLIYRGTVLISINFLEKSNFIEINCKDFLVNAIKINKLNCNWEINNDKEILIINNELGFKIDNEYKIEITFDWKKISEEVDGFYYTKKNNKLVCTTHLEPISARKFIPCFDHPNLKANFTVIVKIGSEFNCISNMSIKKVNLNKTNNSKLIYYNTTPLMSTYLLCLVCGEIKASLYEPLKSKGGIIVNGYCIEDDIKYINWSVKKTVDALDFFESWFNIKYPFDKLDIASIPNFLAGAMENWGLITFREECILLYNKKNFFAKVKILEVIYHEVAHQWFGNLVTLSNWRDLWLNEATATFFSWMALSIMYPEYYTNEFNILLESKNVYLIDALDNTHPIIINDNGKLDPSELFDEITYSKGNMIINYVANLLGLKNFQLAIKKYLGSYLYSNPVSGDKLFEYFDKYSYNINVNFTDFMNKLILTKGYPILYIKKNNDTQYNFFYKTFNLNKNIMSDFPVDIFLKIKNNNQIKILNLKFNRSNDYDINGVQLDNLINPNNELFCICYYDNFKPNIQIMNQCELIKYSNDEFILGLYGHKDINSYLDCIQDIFNLIDINNNIFLCFSILNDILYLIDICIYLNMDYSKLINFVDKNLNKKLIYLCNNLFNSSNKFSEFVLENIFILKTTKFERHIANNWAPDKTKFENTNLINMIKKLYDYQMTMISKSSNYFNQYYLPKTIFKVIMKYYQDTEFNKLLNILRTCDNSEIINRIIESFSYLNDKNFNIIFNNYSQLIKSQDYSLFFQSISKIVSKQEFLINYWFTNRNIISTIDEITFKILLGISKNIYNSKLIDKILNHIELILNDKNKLVISKIKDILIANKIIIPNIKKYLL